MLKVIVCDDDPIARKTNSALIEDLGHEVVAQARHGKEVIDFVQKLKPDLVILDIRMPVMDGLSCARELNKLKDNAPDIIFASNYEHFAVQAFQAKAVGYIIKPLTMANLSDSVEKVAANKLSLEHALEAQKKKPHREHIAAKTRNGLELINVDDIYYFAADDKYVQVRHKGGTVLIDETLKQLEAELGGLFFRIHRGSLMSLKYLKSLKSTGVGRFEVVFTEDIGDSLPISRRYLPLLRERIQKM